uniref:RNA-binding domain-containing protein n=2 Tax=Panagrellus redivivus TaxID=6233 RepID=A0A7E4UPS5_PANRE
MTMGGERRNRSRSRSPVRRGGGGGGGGRRGERRPIDPHSDRMVYLSNLPFELKWNELKDMIRQKVGESAFVEFLEDDTGKPRGCAVLDFDNRDAALRCVQIFHRMNVGGRNITAKEIREPLGFFRHIKTDTGIDFLANRTVAPGSSRPRARREKHDDGPVDTETYGLSPTFLSQLSIKPPLVNRVFITNISYLCNVGKLYDVFSLAGKITWIDLQMDNEGKTKGMAVVQYSHPIEAVQAISMLNNQRLMDRTISVKMDRFEKEAERPTGELPHGLRAIGMGLGANGAPLANVASVLSSLTGSAPIAPMPQQAPIVQPFLNPPQQAANGGGYGAPAGYGAIPPVQPVPPVQANPFNGGPMGDAGFQQSHHQVAPVQNPQQGYPPSGGYFGAAPVQPINNGPPMGQQSGNAYGGPQGGNMYKSPQVTGSGSVNGPPSGGPTGGYGSNQGGPPAKSFYETSRNILIKNLPIDYTWQIVHDRVQKFGEVESSEIISPGVAKVRFLRVADAERTKSTLSGTTVEGRIIAIEYL